MATRKVKVGNIGIGGGSPIVVQTMCNTHTSDVEATLAQCRRLHEAGAQMIRLTVPGLQDIKPLREIHERLRGEGIDTPLVADIHFSSETAIEAAKVVEKVRINPGNFHRDHQKACEQFSRLVAVCREHGTAIRIGLNSGSLPKDRKGTIAEIMSESALEYIDIFESMDFHNIVVSLKSSDGDETVDACTRFASLSGYPQHIGVTEAGSPVISAVRSTLALSKLLSASIGDTIRISMTGDRENEVIAARELLSSMKLRKRGVRIISCPRCGRNTFDKLNSLAMRYSRTAEYIVKYLEKEKFVQ